MSGSPTGTLALFCCRSGGSNYAPVLPIYSQLRVVLFVAHHLIIPNTLYNYETYLNCFAVTIQPTLKIMVS